MLLDGIEMNLTPNLKLLQRPSLSSWSLGSSREPSSSPKEIFNPEHLDVLQTALTFVFVKRGLISLTLEEGLGPLKVPSFLYGCLSCLLGMLEGASSCLIFASLGQREN